MAQIERKILRYIYIYIYIYILKTSGVSLLLFTSSRAKSTSKLAGSTKVEVTAEENEDKVEDAEGPEDAKGSPDARIEDVQRGSL